MQLCIAIVSTMQGSVKNSMCLIFGVCATGSWDLQKHGHVYSITAGPYGTVLALCWFNRHDPVTEATNIILLSSDATGKLHQVCNSLSVSNLVCGRYGSRTSGLQQLVCFQPFLRPIWLRDIRSATACLFPILFVANMAQGRLDSHHCQMAVLLPHL